MFTTGKANVVSWLIAFPVVLTGGGSFIFHLLIAAARQEKETSWKRNYYRLCGINFSSKGVSFLASDFRVQHERKTLASWRTTRSCSPGKRLVCRTLPPSARELSADGRNYIHLVFFSFQKKDECNSFQLVRNVRHESFPSWTFFPFPSLRPVGQEENGKAGRMWKRLTIVSFSIVSSLFPIGSSS